MSSSRLIKTPAKLQDCVLGDDLDNAIENSEEKLKIHNQCDGKTNNITFKTDSIEAWKAGIVRYFEKTEIVKSTTQLTVIKVTVVDDADIEFSVKFNLYSSGSVVIQGSKCRVFESKFFSSLKENVHLYDATEDNNKHGKVNTNTETVTKHDEETSAKFVFDDSEMTITDLNANITKTSTPKTVK